MNFKNLRKCGTGVMHTFVVTLCMLLTICNIYGAHVMSMKNFPIWLKAILIPLYYFMVANYLSAYLQAVFSDPGRPPKAPEDTITPRCSKCYLIKPQRTHHCSVCGLCCMKYDHHCPWVANCVGLKNYGYFLKFLSWGFIASSLSLLIQCCALFFGKYCYQCELQNKILASVLTLMFTACSILCTATMIFSHIPYVKYN